MIEQVLCVGGTDNDWKKWNASDFGPHVDVWALTKDVLALSRLSFCAPVLESGTLFAGHFGSRHCR